MARSFKAYETKRREDIEANLSAVSGSTTGGDTDPRRDFSLRVISYRIGRMHDPAKLSLDQTKYSMSLLGYERRRPVRHPPSLTRDSSPFGI